MKVDRTNYRVANDATRDVLFMYRDLIESYGGFGHGIDVGSFDPFEMARIQVDEAPGESLELDQDLLRVGSLVAVICVILDSWDESDVPPGGKWGARARSLLESGILENYPDLHEAIRVGLVDEQGFRSMLPAIYERHVLGYFRRLVGPANQSMQADDASRRH